MGGIKVISGATGGVGLLLAALLSIAATDARAQQARDNSLLPDFLRVERARQQREAAGLDPYDESALPKIKPPQPQDPLDDKYNSFTSAETDKRQDRLTQDPLQRSPDGFRDEKFRAELQAKARAHAQSGGKAKDWRRRDDAAFDPLGVRAGSFVFFPEVHSKALVTDNIFAVREKEKAKSDVAAQISPSLRVLSDWNVHELELFAGSEHTRWRYFNSEDTDEFELRARGRLDITRRTSLELGGRYEQEMEGRGSPDLPNSAATPAITGKGRVYGQFKHSFNRLGFRLRGSLERNSHENVRLNDGSEQRNELRDFDEKRLEARVAYEFSPALTVFSDGERGWRDFRFRRDDEGFLQGSESWLAAVGANLSLGPSIDISGRIGFLRSTPDAPQLDDIDGAFIDAKLVMRPTRLMRVTLGAKTELEETTQSDTAGGLKHTYSLEAKNDWTRRLSSTLGAFFETEDYEQIGVTDSELQLNFGLDYTLGRSWVVDADYQHIYHMGLNDYRENIYQIGLKLRR